MRRSVVVLLAVLAAALTAASGPAQSTHRTAAQVAIFYYTWYGTPARDGAWQHWTQHGATPPGKVASSFYPARGAYSSTDPRVVEAQMREIADMGIDTLVVSWWGPGSVEDTRLGPVAKAAHDVGLAVAIHVEPWDGRTPGSVRAAIDSLRALQIRDFYVYDSMKDDDVAWASALLGLEADTHVFANTWLPGKARAGGFQGLYSYDIGVYRGDSFRRICGSAHRLGLLCGPSVGPGFDARRATPMSWVVDRRKGSRYDQMWQAAIDAGSDVVTITSYNEWHEGTQIEPARAKKGYASYEGAWGLTGAAAERAYIDQTRYWVTRLRSQ
jgi:glycoprotein endo-alpha-1,2-mannosidase